MSQQKMTEMSQRKKSSLGVLGYALWVMGLSVKLQYNTMQPLSTTTHYLGICRVTESNCVWNICFH